MIVLQGDNDHDVWICVLVVLLSHTLIYNSVGTIDENVLQHLESVMFYALSGTDTCTHFVPAMARIRGYSVRASA